MHHAKRHSQLLVTEIVIEFRKRTERCQFKRFPSRREYRLVIVAPMFLDKVLFTTLKLSVYGVHILNKLVLIVSKACIKEPKWSMCQRELLYNLCAQSNL